MPNEKGYALIELLMEGLAMGGLLLVLCLIGVQSTIAATSLAASRTEAHFAAMKWDLQNLAERQALHYADEASFADSPQDLHFVGSDGVVVTLAATPIGWTGTASHVSLAEDEGCAIFVGWTEAPTNPVRPRQSGEVVCTE